MDVDAEEAQPGGQSEPLTADLFRGQLPNGTRSNVWVTVHAGGSVRLDTSDHGEVLEQYFGRDEREWWVTVSAAHRDRLILALLKQGLRRRSRC
jgi:hypothetical protein